MAKLYLIRRNLEGFSGPLTLAEVKDAYKRMQFGLADEVSGHCGPWVTMDNLERIKKQYPEVARIVHEDMLEGWGISDSDGHLINEDTKRVKVKSTRGVGLALAFLLIAVLAFVAAVYMANSAKMSGKAKEQLDSTVRPEAAQALLDRGDHDGFDRFMQRHATDVIDQLQQQRPVGEAWLPYLRYYAFNHDGLISGLEPKVLRGNTGPAAPVDCSFKTWRRRWRASYHNWNDALAEHKLVRAHWARLLAWDPYWIKRRDGNGWLGTQNYYTACLVMASRALNDLALDNTVGPTAGEWEKLGLSRLKARLGWQLAVAQGTPAPIVPLTTGDSVGLWTCFEAARDVPSLQKCRTAMANGPLDVWHAYNEERYGWNLLRLAAATHGNLPPDLARQITQQSEKMNQEDHFTRFDYHPETRLLNSLLSPELPAEKAVERTQSEFPDVKLSH